MKFKNAVFVDQKFMETIQKCNEYEDWEPKGAYWFNRLVKKLRSAQEDYNDTREKLIKKYVFFFQILFLIFSFFIYIYFF